MSAEELKAQGNDAFSKKDFDRAIDCYSKAIEMDKDNHILYSNRSAAYIGKESFSLAVDDANIAIQLLPTFTKAYFRKANALQSIGDVQGNIAI